MKHTAPKFILAALCLLPAYSAPALAQEFPLTIENRFGTTVIPHQPERVATVDYAGVDNVLALGFQPLTARAWFGPYEDQLWPWAQDLATVEPEVLEGDLNFEQIASTDPDIILALRSGITQADYDKLSLIAPVVAVPPGRGDYDLDWEEQAELAGLALGRSEEAAAQIAEVKASLAAVAAAHPQWQGKTFAMMTYWAGSVGLYSVSDSSGGFVSALGLVHHPRVAELSTPGEFYIEISEEILPEIDADVIFWFAAPDSPEIAGLVAREAMRAPREGREIFLALDSPANGAMSFGSLLSLPEAAERLAPMIDAAIDGDPATEVPLD
ncbi:ABC transporter substrate-binding protein [Pelagibacterium xiamenense]|uniref:ABC transporter substrate-binding protein n=1 Tax=Pelagibacterium xiamenense TaxID=2901140 RepID=UPI001E39C53E|nr:ABC transporter substrate-binding protein [Pelagibacterium xiamenense]MCD7058673.1 ABC transporter substrate-binding protein [Pelagibacterium xiamenense]